MNILVIDTTTDNLIVGIKHGNDIYRNDPVNTHKHMSYLMTEIDKLFDKSSLTLDNIDIIAVGVGPGSFTGIRVGVATAIGLSNRRRFNTIGVNSMDLLAYIVSRQGGNAFQVVIPSTTSKYYVAEYRDGVRVGDILVKTADEIRDNASISGINVYGLNNCGFDNVSYTTDDFIEYVEREAKSGNYSDLVPCYVALSQAEKELLDREGKSGD